MNIIDTEIQSLDPEGKVFAPEIDPNRNPSNVSSVPPFTISEKDCKVEQPQVPVEVKKYPEYMEEENAKNLYEEEILNSQALSPLSFMYYLSRKDLDNPKDSNNVDLQNALKEQNKIYELYASKQKINPAEWEIILQNPSGWKEITSAVNLPDFGVQTVRYLRVRMYIADLNHENKLYASLKNTADLIESNIKRLNNGTQHT